MTRDRILPAWEPVGDAVDSVLRKNGGPVNDQERQTVLDVLDEESAITHAAIEEVDGYYRRMTAGRDRAAQCAVEGRADVAKDEKGTA